MMRRHKFNFSVEMIAKISLVAALYSVLSILIPVGSGMIQFRVAEVLNLLALIDPLYIPALTIGCAITNALTSPLGIIDVIVGSLATLISTFLIYKFRKNIWLASVWPAINGIIIALEGYLIARWPFWFTFASIGLTELVIVTGIGVPLFKYVIFKNTSLMQMIKIKR